MNKYYCVKCGRAVVAKSDATEEKIMCECTNDVYRRWDLRDAKAPPVPAPKPTKEVPIAPPVVDPKPMTKLDVGQKK